MESGLCEQWKTWFAEEEKIQVLIDAIAESGGSTVGLPERMKANDAREPRHEISEPCNCVKVSQ